MMRSFGLIALLVVLLIVAWLSVRQASVLSPSLPGGGAAGAASAPANVREQSQQIQKQVLQEINKAMQQEQERRDLTDEAK
jgi:hypothetical protein